MFRRFAVAVFGVVLALSGASAASAQTGPSVSFFTSALPVVGAQLPGTTVSSLVPLKDGWTMTSPNGIASASVDYSVNGGPGTQIWSYPPPGSPGGADTVTGEYQWSQSPNDETGPFGTATDELGNTGSNGNGGYVSVGLSDYTSATYSGGWRTSQCKCYTSGHILYSTKPGATATFVVCSLCAEQDWIPLVSFVSDTGPTRGEVALTINGHTKDVNLSVGSVTHNRVIVWNSGYLPSVFHRLVLTVKVLSGRVDVEGFLRMFNPDHP